MFLLCRAKGESDQEEIVFGVKKQFCFQINKLYSALGFEGGFCVIVFLFGFVWVFRFRIVGWLVGLVAWFSLCLLKLLF